MGSPGPIHLRTEIRPGDLGEIVRLHGVLYAAEHGFDATFEAYVAEPLAEFVRCGGEGGRLWIAETVGRIVGCVAIVHATAHEAQLRWFLVTPDARGTGLGTRLLSVAVSFARESGYGSLHLWTVVRLTAAASLYRRAGFELAESRTRRQWGTEVVEERYALRLT